MRQNVMDMSCAERAKMQGYQLRQTRTKHASMNLHKNCMASSIYCHNRGANEHQGKERTE